MTSSMRVLRRLWIALFLLAIVISSGGTARADLMLTGPGTTKLFSLCMVAAGFPLSSGIGPLGIAPAPGFGLLVTDDSGNVRVLPGDIAPGCPLSLPTPTLPSYGGGNALGLAYVVTGATPTYYMTQQTLGLVLPVTSTGAPAGPAIGPLTHPTGIVAFPYSVLPSSLHNHLFVSTGEAEPAGMPSIYNVDPTTGIPVGLVFGNGIDGLAISADGGTLYGAHGPSTSDPSGPQIEGFSTATGALVYSSGVFSDGCVVDGVAVGAGSLAGNLYATCNNTGNVWEVVIATGVKTMILTGVGPGGVRDDFVAPDWNVVSGTPTAMFPSLLIVQSDKIYRLDPPGGGFFSPSPPIQSPPSIPTLSSTGIFLLVALLLLAAVITLRRREASLLTK